MLMKPKLTILCMLLAMTWTTLLAQTTTFKYKAAAQVAKFDTYANFTGATSVKSHTFANGIGTVIYNGKVTALEANALKGASITSITLPAGIIALGERAFDGCSKMESITFEDNAAALTSINDYAFAGCDAITSFVIPNSVTTFGKNVFQSCDELVSITIGEGIPVIGESTFLNCKKLKTVIFTGTPTLTTIGGGAFSYCEALTAIDIPASVVTIGASAFNNCKELASVTFAANAKLTTIEGSAFSYCKKLTSIDLPNSLETLGHLSINYMDEEQQNGAVFMDCGLTTLHLPNSIKNIYGGGHLANCPLTSLTMEDDGWPYESPEGTNAIVDQRNRTLVIGCAATKGLTNLQFIEEEAFWAEQQPFSLTLPSNLVQIGKRAFHLASGLTSINIPGKISTIPEDCFSGTSLTTLTLHDGVTKIERQAFMFCPNLKTVYLGRYLTSIGDWAFEGCEKVEHVYCAADPTQLTWDGKGFAATTIFHVRDANAWQTAFPSATVQFETYAPEEDFITVGKQSYSHSYPIGANSKYRLSQQLFTAEQIGHAAGKITSLGFNTENGGVTRNYKVYVSTTNESSIYSYTAPTNANLVFSGDVNFKSGQWNAIDFDNPFQYDGTSNLLVTICDNTGTSGDYSSLTNYITSVSSQFIEADSNEQPFDATNANTETDFSSSFSYKSQIQLCFEVNPKPAHLTATDISDTNAKISCTLRSGATSWNLRYRKVGDEAWIVDNGLTGSQTQINNLTAATLYEVQVQAVFNGNKKSVWTNSLTFNTSCCPIEDMCEILYSMNVQNPNNAAFQIVDAETGIEAAYVTFSTGGVSGGALSLCAGRTYNVNFIVNNAAPYQTGGCNFTLFFTPGDEFYTMNFNEAPKKDCQLTSFVMECGNYCTPRPRFLTIGEIDYQSVELSYDATTKKEEIQYSTDPTFPDNESTKTVVVTRKAEEEHTTYILKNLESLTLYYIRVRSECEEGGEEIIGDKFSRWTAPMTVITESKYARPTRIRTTAVNSSTEDLAWKRKGMEVVNDLNYRTKGAGSPANNVMTIDLDGDGDTFNKIGSTTYESYTYNVMKPDNVIAIYNVPANAMVSWKAAQGITGRNIVNFQYGFAKQTKKYTDEEVSAAQAALTSALQEKKQQEEEAQEDEDYVENSLEEARVIEAQIALAEGELCEMDPSSEEYIQKQEEINLLQNQLEKIVEILHAPASEEDVAVIQAALAGAQAEEKQDNARNMSRRAPSTDNEEYYFFFIRHTVAKDILLVQDITVTPKENIGEWITIPKVKDVNYVLKNLQPGKEYEVMVEPVYNSGAKGLHSPISIFTTLGTEAEPLDGVFSVSNNKKVSFAKGNLQYSKDANWNDHWSLAEKQYDFYGLDNLETQDLNPSGNRFPSEDHLDLFCWNAGKSANGTIYTYPNDSYYTGDFIEWGTLPAFMSIYGQGWSTLSNDEWAYLLSSRKDAATLQAFVTISITEENKVKGLLLLPDEWKAPEGAPVLDGSVEITAAQWTSLENAGAVFLPAAGNLTVQSEDSHTIATVNDVNIAGSYWSSTSSKTNINAYGVVFNSTKVTSGNDQYRRIGSAVRLVKAINIIKGDADGDGVVDVNDVTTTINYILGKPYGSFNFDAANVDGDDAIDVNDVQGIIDIALGKNTPKQ